MRFGPAGGMLILALLGGASRADLVTFARGGQARARVTVEGESVRLDVPGGPIVLPRGEVAGIVPEPDPGRDWPAIRDAASRTGSPEARFDAAWWALENGLTPEAVGMIEASGTSPSAHGSTARCLGALRSLAPPCPDPPLLELRERLRPARFREIRGPHVVLLHQAQDADARERLDVIERVVTTFLLGMAAEGIPLPPPPERLVSVWFADRRDYVDFLRRSDSGPFLETRGYYHPTWKAVFAFDNRSGESQAASRRSLANREKSGLPAPDLARQKLLLDMEWRALDLGIAAHETVHQLVAACGLAPRLDDFPAWLHEGLAAQYEVVRGGRWAGVGRVNELRLPDWRSIRPRPRLAPLLLDGGPTLGYHRDLYAESWALVYYLRKARPGQFRTFLDLLRAPAPDDQARPDRSSAAFRAATGGDLAAFEADWRRFVDGLRTTPDPSPETRLARPLADH